jgi:hypothetical protein
MPCDGLDLECSVKAHVLKPWSLAKPTLQEESGASGGGPSGKKLCYWECALDRDIKTKPLTLSLFAFQLP